MLRSDIGEVKRVELGPLNYYRLTVLPGIWVAFEGMENLNLLMNMADLEHDPEEVDRKDLEAYPLLG
jgi:dTDP-4-dehydrorhamnose 3,5-epimerase